MITGWKWKFLCESYKESSQEHIELKVPRHFFKIKNTLKFLRIKQIYLYFQILQKNRQIMKISINYSHNYSFHEVIFQIIQS